MTLLIRTAFLATLLTLVTVLTLGDGADARNVYGPDYVTPDERYFYSNPDRVYPQIVDEAMRRWDRLGDRYGNRGIHIRKADAKHPASVVVHGVRDFRSQYYGFVPVREKGQKSGAIYLNTCTLSRENKAWKLHVAGHEAGHTLGFEHPPKRYCKVSILCSYGHTQKPGSYDEKLYRNRWIR